MAKVEYETAMAGRLAPGDVVVADAVPGSGPRERGKSHIALVGLAERPVVIRVPEETANLATMLPMMGLDAAFAANVLVMNTTGARAPLPDGTVLAFPPGTETNQDWDAYGDLEPEPAAPAPTVADFAPIPPAEPKAVAAAPVLRPARRAANRPAAAPPAAAPMAPPAAAPIAPPAAVNAEPVVTGRSEPLSLPPLPTAAAPTASVPAPPPGIIDGPDETIVVDLLDAPPAGGTDDGFGDGFGEADFGGLALLPAPDESPFYGDDAALADNGSHLIALPEPGYAPPGMASPGLPAPGGIDPMRVATRPTPGVIRDSPRLSSPNSSLPNLAAPPQPMTGGGRPVGTPVPPMAAPPRVGPVPPAAIEVEPAAEEPATAETAEAGVPWVTLGFVFGALLGGIGAAGVALKRRTAALVTANRTADPAGEKPAPAPEISEAAVRRAAERTATADRKVLDDLLADRLPLREEAVSLPKHVALHGATTGKAKLRLDDAHETLAAPHFAPAGSGLRDGVRSGATPETVSVCSVCGPLSSPPRSSRP